MKDLIKYDEDTWLKKFHFQEHFKMRNCRTYLSFLKYFYQARMDYFKELGLYNKLYTCYYNLVNTEMSCNIRGEIKYGEYIEVLVRTINIDKFRIDLEYIILNSYTREIIVVGNGGFTLVDKKHLFNIAIPKTMKKTLYNYEKL